MSIGLFYFDHYTYIEDWKTCFLKFQEHYTKSPIRNDAEIFGKFKEQTLSRSKLRNAYCISSYNCRGNYSFLNSSSEETIQVFVPLM